MKKIILTLLCAMAILSMVACTKKETTEPAGDEVTLTGTGKGYGGLVTVTVTKKGDTITSVVAVGEKETNGIGSKAIEELPQKIVEANSPDVDVISGATFTSNAIIYAVKNALDPAANPAPTEETTAETQPAAVTAANVYQGLGISYIARTGPGEDDKAVPVYSINQVFANALFDESGKILDLNVDILEVATPNYDGDGMPHFSGFPGQGGYNNDENHDAVVDGTTPDTEENFLAEIDGWLTKRDRGDAYRMTTGTWASQMDKFEQLFIGMTVDEVEAWFEKYTSDVNGRPLKEDSDKEGDPEKYAALTEEEKTMLADVVSGATMSLNDSHGNIIEAIRKAFDNRVGLEITEAASQGFGLTTVGRIGPGEDDKGVSVYSINEVAANTLFDKDGKIVALYVDILEVATPNYDGDGMPHFSGFPGQPGYNSDDNHDGTVDSTTTNTDESFAAEIAGWATKRDRGEEYRMNTGTWASQMDAYQNIFIGKTVEEVEEWFAKYTSDVNGRLLKADSDKPEDVAKYGALTDDEKAMLTDVVASASMSLKDPHGDIIGAIKESFENRVAIDLTIQ